MGTSNWESQETRFFFNYYFRMSLTEVFWSRHFWLPDNLTWEDLEIDGKSVMPSCWNLLMCIPVTIILLFVRYFWENVIALPLGRYFKLSEKNYKNYLTNEKLNKLLEKFGKLKTEEVINLCVKETDLTSRQVERYVRIFKKSKIPSKMKKFTETSWMFIFYFSACCFGIWSLWDKSWLVDPDDCWRGWPFHIMPTEIYWYYILECSFYISLSISLCVDVKRKDFVEMIIHHIATIALITFSYMDNFYRVGSLIIILHDPCDVILQFGKMSKYLKYQRITDTMFVLFTLSWFVSRLVLLPSKIVKAVLFETPLVASKPHVHWVFCSMLITLQILHVVWFYFIIKAIQKVLKGQQATDTRSETESSASSVENDNECISNGALSNGVLSNGILSNGILSKGVLSNGAISNGVHHKLTNNNNGFD